MFTLATALVVVLGGWFYLDHLSTGLRDATDASLRSRAILLRQDTSQLSNSAVATTPPSTSDAGGLLTQVIRPDQAVAEESPALRGNALLNDADRARLRSGRSVLATRMTGDDSYRVLAEPLARTGGSWTVLVAAPREETQETIDSLEHSLLVAGALVILFAGLGSWVLGSAALRAVDRMRLSVENMTAADMSVRVKIPPGNDELAALGTTFNALLDRLSVALARQRRFVADAGHELRGPLAVLRIELELADRPQRTRPQLAAAISAAADEVDRMARLANDLLFLARSDDGELQVDKRRVEIEPLLNQAVAGRALAAAHAAICMDVDVPNGLQALVDADRLRHALDNLLDNALRVTASGGRVVVKAQATAGRTEISVCDSGPGFPPEFLPLAFQRFSRPDQARTDSSGGSGLGLAIVQAVAEAHGGKATARNVESGGATVTIAVPGPGPGPGSAPGSG
jgi:two-component system, OmpR family, sensor kinase